MSERKRRTISPSLQLDESSPPLATPLSDPGASPGTLFANPEASPTTVHWMRYHQGSVEQGQIAQIAELPHANARSVLWLDVRGLSDREMLHAIGHQFGIHPLALADMVNTPQRPKTDLYREHALSVAHMFHRDGDTLTIEQVSVFLGEHFVITVQERDSDGDVLEPVRQRIISSKGKIRSCGADYLTYALLDCIVDAYFPVLEQIGGILEDLEFDVLAKPTRATAQRIYALKRTMLLLRRSIWPQREALNVLLRGDDAPDMEHETLTPQTRVYLRDVVDHAVQVLDMVETYREFAASLMDLYLSSVNIRMNEVVKVLTIISTIFLPLSFIAGVYGMNFETTQPLNMPELHWKYGYIFAWALMIGVAAVMLGAFRYFGWLGGKRAEE